MKKEVSEHKQANPFYLSKKWRMKRENVLRRDKYECRECKRYGRVTAARIVHHVYPLEQYPEHKLNSENLISVCHKCHEGMHIRELNEMTDTGKAWMNRVENKLCTDETLT